MKNKERRKYIILTICFLFLGSIIFLLWENYFKYSKIRQDEKNELVVYTQHPTEFIIPIVKEYESISGVHVKLIQGGSGELLKKIANGEDNPKADVLWGGSLYMVKPYEELFEDVQTVNESFIQPEFENIEGNMTRFTDMPSVIMINTDLIGDIKIEGYRDLLKPELKGKIAFADPNISSSSFEQLVNMLYACRDENGNYGFEYIKELYTQLDGKLLNSSSEVYNGVTNGKYIVGLTFEEAAAGLKDDGKHVDIIYMKEGVVSTPDGVYLVKNTPHKDNGISFINFLTSYDTQYMISRQLNRRSVRSDVDTPPLLPEKSDINVIKVDAAQVEQNTDEWLKKFNEIWGLE